jgi:predicted RNase H-like HicB family nuclease
VRRYSIVLIPDQKAGGFTVQVPAIPGCFTEGDTIEECVENARDVIQLFLDELVARGEPIPEEPEGAQVVSVEV